MNKQKVPQFIRSTKNFMSKHSPEILVGLGITGMMSSTVLAVKATPKALRLIEQAKREEHKDKLTPLETVKVTWKCYIPTTITCVTSIACLVGASSVNARRNAALATAYKLSETAFADYREKVVETIGEKKEELVRDKVDQAVVERHPVAASDVIYTGYGNTLFFDPLSGRHFVSDIDRVQKVENELNNQMIHDTFGYVTLNEFYDEIGLPRIDIGDMVGWNVHRLIKIHLGSQLDNGRPCAVVNHQNRPDYHYDRL